MDAEHVRDCWSCSLGSERTMNPYVTGTSVLAVKYRDGILMAADMGGSYGSTLRYKTIDRIKPIGKHSPLGASGEISDFQEILRYLDELILYDNMWDDGNSLGPKEVHNYLIGTKTNTVPVTCGKYLDEIIFCLQNPGKYQKKKYLVVGENYLDEKTIFHLNQSPCFLIGGPQGDADFTGRKIVIDTNGATYGTGKIPAKIPCHFGIEGPHGDAALPGHDKILKMKIIIIIIIVVIGAVVVVVIIIG